MPSTQPTDAVNDRATITEKLEGHDGSDAGPLRPVLVVVHGPTPGRIGERVVIPPHSALTLGRSEPVLDGGPLADPRMSSRHATVRLQKPLGLEVHDLGSKNGIAVGGARVDRAVLRPGEVVQLGRTFLMYRLEPAFAWRDESSALTGVSYLMHLVRQAISRAARHDQPVLVLGPSGAGKEPTAREVHRLGGRPGPLIPVNCGALPSELVESELFGHVAGAFTGAGSAKPGLVKLADGGTLFLDELGTMPMALQPKLLRVIQDRCVRPVGGSRELGVDVRIVAATNEDVVDLVRTARLREDLYGRLSGALIRVPPLSERTEDIGALAQHFLGASGHPALQLAPELLWELLLHPWPLNVRALEQLIRASAASATGDTLSLTRDVKDLLDAQRDLRAPRAEEPQRSRSAPGRKELEALLERHGGVVARVAGELGVHRYQVYRWMSAAGIDPAGYRGE